MKYIYTLLFSLTFTLNGLGQNLEYHLSLGSNISLSSFNDKTYSYPEITPTTGYFSYSPLPPNIYRKTIPKVGFQIQGDVDYKLDSKFLIGTGFKVLLYRHAYNQEFKENPFDPYGKRWSSEFIKMYPENTPAPAITLSDNSIYSRIIYLSLPIQVTYLVNKQLFTYGGVSIATPISVAQKHKAFSFHTSQSSFYRDESGNYLPNSTTSITENTLTDKNKSAFNRISYSIQLGMGFKTSPYTSIKIDLNHGISNTYNDMIENNGIRSLMRTLNVSYDCLVDL